jgi:hypothetical protein
VKSRISGKEAVYVARESERRRPVKLLASDRVDGVSVDPLPSETADEGRKAPPRIPKRFTLPRSMHGTDLESYRTPRHSKAMGLGSRPQWNERWAGAWGGDRRNFEINPPNPMDHSRQRFQAPRCGARTPSGIPCQRPAVRGRKRCRLHGGLSPGAPRGQENGNFKTGNWTIETIEERNWLRSLLRSFAKPTRTE